MNIIQLVHEKWKYNGTYFNSYYVVMMQMKPFNIEKKMALHVNKIYTYCCLGGYLEKNW